MTEPEPEPEPEVKSEASQASGGCGTGTVLVDGVCQLAPVESSGCGAGTVMVDGVCQLDKSSGSSIPPLYIAGGAAAIGAAVIGIIFAVKRGSSGTTTKPAKQDLDDYESKYIARQDVEPRPKPAETKETSMFCDNCGAAFKKSEAKFCGECGTQRS